MAELKVEGASPRRWRWMIVAAAAVLVIGVAAAGLWAVGGESPGGRAPTPAADASTGSTSTPDSGSTADPPSDGEAPADGASPLPRETRAPVTLEDPAEPVSGLTVTLVSIEEMIAESAVPGEVGGPALLVSVEIRNDSANPVPTGEVIVNMFSGTDASPANILVDPRQDFPGEVPPGEPVIGVFAFSVAPEQRQAIRVEVDVAVDAPIVVFAGSV